MLENPKQRPTPDQLVVEIEAHLLSIDEPEVSGTISSPPVEPQASASIVEKPVFSRRQPSLASLHGVLVPKPNIIKRIRRRLKKIGSTDNRRLNMTPFAINNLVSARHSRANAIEPGSKAIGRPPVDNPGWSEISAAERVKVMPTYRDLDKAAEEAHQRISEEAAKQMKQAVEAGDTSEQQRLAALAADRQEIRDAARRKASDEEKRRKISMELSAVSGRRRLTRASQLANKERIERLQRIHQLTGQRDALAAAARTGVSRGNVIIPGLRRGSALISDDFRIVPIPDARRNTRTDQPPPAPADQTSPERAWGQKASDHWRINPYPEPRRNRAPQPARPDPSMTAEEIHKVSERQKRHENTSILLPWTVTTDVTGRRYYYNPQTGEKKDNPPLPEQTALGPRDLNGEKGVGDRLGLRAPIQYDRVGNEPSQPDYPWTRRRSPATNRIYYWNAITGAQQSEFPVPSPVANTRVVSEDNQRSQRYIAARPEPPAPWTRHLDESGLEYYHNPETGVSQHIHPLEDTQAYLERARIFNTRR